MNISVEYKDYLGITSTRLYTLNKLAFVKHLAIAGQRYAPTLQKLIRKIGMFFIAVTICKDKVFTMINFLYHPPQLYDTTEKGQFSNLTGKAIADFLSKRIDGSLFTVNYEAAMKLRGMPLNVG